MSTAIRICSSHPATAFKLTIASKVHVSVNGWPMTLPWGEGVIPVHTGIQVVEVGYLYAGRIRGRQSVTLHVAPDAMPTIEYRIAGWPRPSTLTVL
jgi:hypothetical protein